MTLRLRVVLFTLAILLPAIAGGAWMVASNVSRDRATVETRIRETTRALSLVVDRELEHRAAIVEVLAASPQIQDMDLDGFCRLAMASLAGVQGSVALLDRERQYANTLLPGCVLRVPRARALVSVVPFAVDSIRLSDLFQGEMSGQQLTVLSVPVRVKGHDYNVSLGIRPVEFQRIIDQQKFPPGWTAAVLNREGRLVARQPDPVRWVGRVTGADMLERLSKSREGAFLGTSFEGEPVKFFYSNASRFDMSFMIAVPRAVLEGNAMRSMLAVSLGALLLLLLGIAIAVWVGRQVARPIEALQAAAGDLEAGRVVNISPTQVAELDQVGTALSQASERIRASNQAMERRIAEAVAEVQSTHAMLVQSQKLEAIGRLTGGIAHDFNNLLQTLSTGLHVLDGIVSEPKARPLIDSGLRAVNRAARLVQHLLSFGRNAAQARHPIDLRNQLLSMETLLGRALPANIVLRTEMAPDLWPVDVDPSLLEVALLNLVFNARDAMDQGGVITLSARNLARPDGDGVAVEVTDDGRGIPADLLAQIFDPFFTTKPVGHGTGLGLAQVRAFAIESGGTVAAKSTEGLGTTITLTLPRSTQAVANEAAMIKPLALDRPCRLLFVEDDVMIAEVVQSALIGAGFTVAHVHNGDEALALLRSGSRFDAVFSDVVMPGSIDGLELAQVLAREFPGMPVVLASGYVGGVDGVSGPTVLPKPYSLQSLITALVEALPHDD